ncbi:hypothetical protein M011DRAFT_474732 [Sporormia fimetaria CBS 119925]|uniref:Uncharacterized protein n=1 Tax=Sporormia fimetaria CBS 119925 TaxID=1340428 RepID=A0A6A6VM27_9PLEO|nr:hypothetical protein M011DRAFT_474732 [Sporormia fimetaria CBS 119925]
MPPKKKSDVPDADKSDKGGGGAWKWTPEREDKLRCLTTIPRQVPAPEHQYLADQLAAHYGTDAPTAGAIRNKLGTMKLNHKKAYQEFGMAWPGSGGGGSGTALATPYKAGTPGKKRVAKTMDDDGDDFDDDLDMGASPKKKNKNAKAKAKMMAEDLPEEDSDGMNGSLGIKAEPEVDDEV